jgi:hypothetical protein
MRQRMNAARNPRNRRRQAAPGFEPLEGRALLSTVSPSVASSTATPAEVLIQEDYLVFLGRQADPTGLAAWTALANNGRSQAVISQQIALSPEAFTRDVILAYQADLGRAPTMSEVSIGVAALQKAGGPNAVIEAQLLAGPEFFAKAGGTNLGYASALYTTVLGRQGEPAGVAAWTNFLNTGGSRSAAAYYFLTSQEHAITEVTAAYQGILGRAPEAAGLAGWTNLVASHNGQTPALSQTNLLVDFLNSPENNIRVNNATTGSTATSAQIASGLINTSYFSPGVAQANFVIAPETISWSTSSTATSTGMVSPVSITVFNLDPTQSLTFKPSIAAANFYPKQIPSSAFTFTDSTDTPLTGPITVAPGESETFLVWFDPTSVSVDSSTAMNYGATLVLLNSYGRQLTPIFAGANGTIPMNLSFTAPV